MQGTLQGARLVWTGATTRLYRCQGSAACQRFAGCQRSDTCQGSAACQMSEACLALAGMHIVRLQHRRRDVTGARHHRTMLVVGREEVTGELVEMVRYKQVRNIATLYLIFSE